MMKKRFKLLASTALALFSLLSCQREPITVGNGNSPDGTGGNTPTVGEGPVCDPDSVYFEQQLLPILVSNCAMSGCHDVASRRDGVILTSYDYVRSTGEIRLNNPTESEIYEVLFDSDPEDRMPPAPRAPLSAEEKALLLKWIEQGAQDLYCEAACDTTAVRFSANIAPLIQSQCQGCHQGGSPSGGIRLDSYERIKEQVDNGQLWGAAARLSGYSPMPPAGTGLSACELRQLEIWIQAGAEND